MNKLLVSDIGVFRNYSFPFLMFDSNAIKQIIIEMNEGDSYLILNPGSKKSDYLISIERNGLGYTYLCEYDIVKTGISGLTYLEIIEKIESGINNYSEIKKCILCQYITKKRDNYQIPSPINKFAQQGDAPEPDSCRTCLPAATSRPGDL